jgi:predicted RNA-binding protein
LFPKGAEVNQNKLFPPSKINIQKLCIVQSFIDCKSSKATETIQNAKKREGCFIINQRASVNTSEFEVAPSIAQNIHM